MLMLVLLKCCCFTFKSFFKVFWANEKKKLKNAMENKLNKNLMISKIRGKKEKNEQWENGK